MRIFSRLMVCAVATTAYLSAAIVSFNANDTGASTNVRNNGVWSTGFSTTNTVLSGGAVDPHYTLIYLPAGCTATGTGAQAGSCQESNSGPLQNPVTDPFGPATYVVLGSGFPIATGQWIANNAAADGTGSNWIGQRADMTNTQVGGTYPNINIYMTNDDFYVFRMVFDLTAMGLNPATANIQLAWGSDNHNNTTGQNSHIRLCSIGSASDPFCPGGIVASSGNNGQGAALTSVTINSGFTSGLMALDFVVYNSVFTGLNPSGLRVDIISATADNDTGIPEPTTVSLIGLGLAAIGFIRRKR